MRPHRRNTWVLKPPAAQGRARGFTLVEALAALALAALILPVAMQGVSIAVSAAGAARRQVEAATLAESKLSDLVATGAWQGSERTGDFGTEWPGYTWTAEVSDWNGGPLRLVEVTVAWTARSAKRSVRLSTLVYAGEA